MIQIAARYSFTSIPTITFAALLQAAASATAESAANAFIGSVTDVR